MHRKEQFNFLETTLDSRVSVPSPVYEYRGWALFWQYFGEACLRLGIGGHISRALERGTEQNGVPFLIAVEFL